MKSPLTIPCACAKQIALEVNGSELPDHASCPDCGATICLIAPLGNVVTKLLMARAKHELQHNDATISTLLSAVAVEAEMAYLFSKWKEIDSGKLLPDQTSEDRKAWEGEWANMRAIGKRLDELSRLLTTKPFDEFARQNGTLLKPAMAGHNPATSIKDFLQEQFFDKRNDIAHYARSTFRKKMAHAPCLWLLLCLNCYTRWTRRALRFNLP